MKVLIIEDEQSIIDAVDLAIEFRWPDVELVSTINGKSGVDMVRGESPDIVILDLNLPDISGFDVLKRIREFSSVPVIILTVRSDEDDMTRGLEIGADDYIVKPFNYKTLLARIKAVMRRTELIPYEGDHDRVINPRLNIDFVNQKVKLDNQLLKLTPIEYQLLSFLARNKDVVVSYSRITGELWDRDSADNTENIRICVRRLRKKLGDNPPNLILNKRGFGYMLKS
jgi:DNA-binding response OmpR family regulator